MSVKCQEATYALRKKALLFDHLVGEREQIVGDFDAERSGGLEVDHELEFGRLQDWQVGGVFALENPPGVEAICAIGAYHIFAISQKRACLSEISKLVDI